MDLSVSTIPPHTLTCLTFFFQEDVQEDFGWKLVHGEVFRSPRYSMILSMFVGNGAQLCTMTGVTLGLLDR